MLAPCILCLSFMRPPQISISWLTNLKFAALKSYLNTWRFFVFTHSPLFEINILNLFVYYLSPPSTTYFSLKSFPFVFSALPSTPAILPSRESMLNTCLMSECKVNTDDSNIPKTVSVGSRVVLGKGKQVAGMVGSWEKGCQVSKHRLYVSSNVQRGCISPHQKYTSR